MKRTLWFVLICLLCLGMAWPALAKGEEGIVFSDAMLEQKVREAIGKPQGSITPEDAVSLTSLDAEAPQGAPEDAKIKSLNGLGAFVNLELLNLSFNDIHNISELAKLPRLRGLWLDSNPIDDLNPLGELTGLDNLSFEGGFRELSFLKNLTELTQLNIGACRVLPPEFAGLSKLTVFQAPGGELEDIGMLAQFPGLTAVNVSWNLVSDLEPLRGLPLTELYLGGNPIEDYTPIREIYENLRGKDFDYIELKQPDNPEAIVAFADPVLEQKIRAALGKPEGPITAGDAAQVTRLDLNNEWQPQIPKEVQVTNLQGIEAFLNLRELNAGFNAISDISILSGLTELRKLELGGNAISDIGPLAGLWKLEDLTLFGSRISDISPLSGHSALRRLHLGNNPVSDIDALTGLTKLTELYMGGCGIQDISPLAGRTDMYRLELSGNYITDLTPLAGMKNLVMLKLANNPIQDYSAIEQIYPRLQEKDFELGQVFDVQVPLMPEQPEEAVTIADAALEAILREAAGVKEGPVTRLDLSRLTKLGGEWQAVSDITALGFCLNLEGLAIWRSQISNLTPLSGLTRLRVLTVNHSPVSDITPLQCLAQLEELDVAYNQITDLSPLYGLQRLSVLRISHNLTPDASGFKEIAKGLKDKDFEPDEPMETATTGGESNQSEGTGQAGLRLPENPGKAIKFADKVLEKRVREAMGKPEGPITAGDAAQVTELYIGNEWQEKFPKGSRITKLGGIEFFINLQTLDISFHQVKDLGKLSGLTLLTYFKAFGNAIQDLKPLSGLTNLTSLNLGGNKIKSVKPLSGLQNLTELMLAQNPIKDFSPVAGIYPRLTSKDFEMK